MLDVAAVVVTGIAAATIAAYIPTRTAARIPVLAALAGRRPLSAVPRGLLPAGLVSFAGGTLLLSLSALSARSVDRYTDLLAAVAVLGGLGVLAGLCCATPAVVSLWGPVGDRVGASTRLAARSLARLRTRSAAVLTATAAAGAFAVAAATFVATTVSDQYVGLPRDAVIVEGQRTDSVEVAGEPGQAARREPIRATVAPVPDVDRERSEAQPGHSPG